ncbi:MAPEG family protein [Roseibium sp.]|uniref:MAPEG family protein n=1 Tax=Roseibium sp. TaxID=1936156 RepID=UPI003A987FE2
MIELAVLLGLAAIVFLSAAIQHGGTVLSRGVGFVMTDRSQALPETGFSGRSRRTLQNNVESALMSGPILTVLAISGTASPLSGQIAAFYLATRIFFTLSYWAGINKLRSVSWGLGMASMVVLFVLAANGLLGQR